ncbi:acyltransferase [Caenimonas sedimenti]|uniref:Acyltransferase n=1 Tax=Caenimonas sedimenti TaxID=2596921 RepID=A0A562ZUW3_9BURK|nr:acyltransferase [Caenimonas sedimenti]TWO72105.1 acyltransferase [Caenimonas sedimenti]
MSSDDAESFQALQARLGDLPGEAGAARRRKEYAPFFLRMGRDVHIEEGCRFYHPDRIVLDDDARLNIGALVYGSGGVWIGRHARIGPRCFIHSANHDLVPSPLAFFERGYQEERVVIADLCLVSANVSILPGARLGPGTFVAAGAVVPRGDYAEGSRLSGLPARAVSAPAPELPEAAVELALVVPVEGPWRDMATHLLLPLGLPQVGVFVSGADLPATVHTALAVGPSGWSPPQPAAVTWWTLEQGEAAAAAPPGLPTHRPLPVANAGRFQAEPADGGIAQVAYWLLNRLEKGSDAISMRDFREWLTALRILELPPGRPDRMRERLAGALARRAPPELRGVPPAPSDAQGFGTWLERQARSADEVGLTWFERRRQRRTVKPAPTLKEALIDPELLLRAVLDGTLGAAEVEPMARKMLAAAPTGARLVCFGIAAHRTGNAACAAEVRETLAQPAWRMPGVAFPRVLADSERLCQSPLVLAWLALEARARGNTDPLEDDLAAPRDAGGPLAWSLLSNGEWADDSRRAGARSLLDHWTTLHSTGVLPPGRFTLSPENHSTSTAGLEAAWVGVFRRMQAAAGRPLLRLRPWPAPYRSALSVRFDVDRPVTAAVISRIAQTQALLANAPCASWYYFAADPDRARQRRQLDRHWQEQGLHVALHDEEVTGAGVTHHSSPLADYWLGDASTRALAASGAGYGEFLANRLHTPRPAWIPDARDGARLSGLWLVPLHFPLEGSVRDTGLDYFDRLRAEFRAALDAGGHAIVASHPDVDAALLRRLLAREDLGDTWFATVGQAVARCAAVLQEGNIRMVASGGGIGLLSRSHLADVAVEIWMPGAASCELHVVQLVPGQPRLLASSSA